MRRVAHDRRRSSQGAAEWEKPPTSDDLDTIAIHPLTPERWPNLETLFGARGTVGGCWCMWWRLPRVQFEMQKGEGNRRAFQAVVASGDTPGLLTYAGGQPVGWCAIAPCEEYPALGRSRTLRPADDLPVWCAVCCKGYAGESALAVTAVPCIEEPLCLRLRGRGDGIVR